MLIQLAELLSKLSFICYQETAAFLGAMVDDGLGVFPPPGRWAKYAHKDKWTCKT